MKLGDVTEFLGFDLETTGVETETDRIVTISTVHRVNDSSNDENGTNATVFNPGVPIPPGATAIHGITDEMVKEAGYSPAEELPYFLSIIEDAWVKGIPLVGCNITFDLSMFSAELKRHCDISFKLSGPIVDIMVLHRMAGNKKATLALMSKYYDVQNATAHDSTSDVIATLDILQKMIAKSPRLQDTDLRDLYVEQKVAHRAWARNMQQYFNRIGKRDQINAEWPIKETV